MAANFRRMWSVGFMPALSRSQPPLRTGAIAQSLTLCDWRARENRIMGRRHAVMSRLLPEDGLSVPVDDVDVFVDAVLELILPPP